MNKKRLTLADEIRRAVDSSGLSHLAIGRATEIDKGLFSRFMAGLSGLSVSNLNKLGDVLDLHITTGKPPTIPKGKAGRKPKTGRKAGKR